MSPGGAAGPDPESELARCRGEIERLDRTLVELLAERVRLARRIGDLKQGSGLPILDPGREAQVIRHSALLAREFGVPEEALRAIFWHIVGLSRTTQLEQR